MGNRRRYFFVLLFVLGLVIASALVIANKATKLGLDLQGGLELVYQGQPTGTSTAVSGEDIEDSISIIEERINKLGVSEPEVARLGNEEITVSLPGITDANRAAEQVGTTAQLYFFDWEPNLLGPERVDRRPPGPAAARGPPESIRKTLERSRPQRQKRREPAADLRRGLPDRLRSRPACGRTGARHQVRELLGRQTALLPLRQGGATRTARRPRAEQKRPLRQPDRQETAERRHRRRNPGRHHPRLRIPDGRIRQGRRNRPARLVRAARQPGALRHEHHRPEAGIRRRQSNRTSTSNSPTRAATPSTKSPARSPSAARRRRSARSTPNRRPPSPATSRSSSTTKSKPGRSSTSPKTRTGSTAAKAPRSPAASENVGEAQELATTLQIGALPINLKLISETQVSATLGTQALHDGIKAGIIGLALVVIFLLLYYRFLGLIASIALAAYGVIFFALINLIPITLTLPGIAGLVLTIGVAADSNIVIFERIKEEVRAGRSMSSAISAGYKRGISTIIDANVVTLLTAFILFVLATAGRQGLRLHPRGRHDRLAADRGRLHPGAARHR